MKLCTARHKATTGEVKQKGNEMKICYSLKFFDTISCTLWSSFSDLIFCQYLLDAIRDEVLCKANMPSNNEPIFIKFLIEYIHDNALNMQSIFADFKFLMKTFHE